MCAAPLLRDYLDGLPDLAARNQSGMRSSDFTLERMRSLLAALGQPQQAYPSLHVAGTNGKGSVCALCAAALQAQGYRVGLFTSPHARGALAGIAVNGVPAAAAELQASFEQLYPLLHANEAWTQFEVVVALMFVHFARLRVDAAVIEVGLGGALDATNVLLPQVAVITPIDYDHTAILGSTLTEIATHKAGIIKLGRPVVVSPQPAEARAAILAQAGLQNAPVVEVGIDLQVQAISADLTGQQLRILSPKGEVELQIGLLGAHQRANAATAYAALIALDGSGLHLSQAAIAAGFAAARWPGRFEVLSTAPPLVLDGAHTSAAARALRRALDEYFPGQSFVLVLGVSIDKDLRSLLEPLLPRIAQVIATQSAHPRAMPATQLAARLAELGLPAAAEPSPAAALAAAQATAGGGLTLVAGSIFLVEEVRGGNQPQ
jgi:dihydrofolate synthase/folylpolyglutamate synthase